MFPQMQQWIQEIIINMKLTDYKIGTVIQVNPIRIDFGENKIITDVGTNIFYTELVLEKKIVLGHKHVVNVLGDSYSTSEELKTYLINEGIKVGDKLLILRVANGQKSIVLSKLRNVNSITIS